MSAFMSGQTEREAQWVEALMDLDYIANRHRTTDVRRGYLVRSRRIMALADQEQADLRAEAERLDEVCQSSAALAESLAERLRHAWDRAEAAEGRLRAVEALADDWARAYPSSLAARGQVAQALRKTLASPVESDTEDATDSKDEGGAR